MRGAASGVLIKSAEALETVHEVNTIVLDKTGTITQGEPGVTDVLYSKSAGEALLVKTAASLEKYSEHPLAQAIVKYAEQKNVQLAPVTGFAQQAGRGIKGVMEGKGCFGGNRRMLEEAGLYDDNVKMLEEKLAAEGKTPLFFARDGVLLGIIALADRVKPTSRAAIEEMKRMGLEVVMLTGDNARTAQAIQKEVGADRVVAEVLPQDKETEIRRLQQQGKKVAMVGDGINDAPVLARSDIGIAMGGIGSDAAIEAADIVIMTDEPSKIAAAMRISRQTLKIARENIVFAIGVKLLVLSLGALGLTSIWAAVFADVGVSVIAILNAIRALSLSKKC